MEIRFTRHADNKFDVLARHGVNISRAHVIDTLNDPDRTDAQSRKPLIIAQSELDKRRVLRVVYKVENGTMLVITFYPGRKSQYDR